MRSSGWWKRFSAAASSRLGETVAMLILIALVFVLDLTTPLAYADWLVYLIPLFLAATRHFRPYWLTALISVLILAGGVASPGEGVPLKIAFANRILAIVVFWVFARFMVGYEKNRQEKLELAEHIRESMLLSESLNKVNDAIHSTLEPEEIMRRVVVESVRAIGAEAGSVGVFDEAGGLRVRYLSNSSSEFVDRLWNEPKGARLAAETRQVLVSNDAANDQRLSRQLVNQLGVQSILIVPLNIQSGISAVLAFFQYCAGKSFSDDHVDFAKKLAASLSLALTNAQLFEQTKTAEQRLKDKAAELEDRNRDLQKISEQLSGALKDKEVLFREVHHRTKNNMNVISSLINLELPLLSDDKSIHALRDIQAKIRAMSLVHEKLYKGNLTNLDLEEYFTELTQSVMRSHGPQQPVQLDIHADACALSHDFAVPCGLVITELMTNALKYAFPAGNHQPGYQPSISISASLRRDSLAVTFADNGVGLPERAERPSVDSLGLRLVHNLVTRQMRGSMEVVRAGGTQIRMIFPLDAVLPNKKGTETPTLK